MYLCICNAITDGEIGRAVAQGCASVSEVFRHLGERPNCGRCVPEICRMVQEGQAVATSAAAQDLTSGDLIPDFGPAPLLAVAAE